MVLYRKIYFREVTSILKKLLLLLPILLFSQNENNNTTPQDESFLSTVEYGRMLYKRPRGISCSQCHGQKGKGGQIIAKYYDKRKNPKLLKGVKITSYSLDDLKASLANKYRENNRSNPHKIMPIYYLTNKEIEAIYAYLQSKN